MKICKSCKKNYKEYNWEMFDLCPDCNDELVRQIKGEELEEILWYGVKTYGKKGLYNKIKAILGKII